jgi:hypothetical protein
VHPAPDEQAPQLTVDALPRSIKRARFLKRLTVRAGCNEPCALVVDVRATPKGLHLASNQLSLATGSLPLGSGIRTLTLKPSRKLIGRSKRFKVELRLAARDAARNTTTRRVTIKVRP